MIIFEKYLILLHPDRSIIYEKGLNHVKISSFISIDIEIRGRMDQDAYIELRCETLMDKIRSARMKNEYADIEMKNEEIAQQPQAAGQFFYFVYNRRRLIYSTP